jgi:hypothetical protein
MKSVVERFIAIVLVFTISFASPGIALAQTAPQAHAAQASAVPAAPTAKTAARELRAGTTSVRADGAAVPATVDGPTAPTAEVGAEAAASVAAAALEAEASGGSSLRQGWKGTALQAAEKVGKADLAG